MHNHKYFGKKKKYTGPWHTVKNLDISTKFKGLLIFNYKIVTLYTLISYNTVSKEGISLEYSIKFLGCQ